MKKIHLLLALPLLFTACKPKAETDAAAAKTDTAGYAYTIKKPDNWEMNPSNANTKIALNALKAFEASDSAAMSACFNDTVTLNADGTVKAPRAQFIGMSKTMRDSSKSEKLNVTDWESVISKDKTEEWVTVWYKVIATDMKDKVDSVDVVNDMMFKSGKISRMDIYGRKLKR